jgi:hypothetical protein
MDVMIPEDTPSYGEGDIMMLYTMQNEDGSPYSCCFHFETEAKMFAHKQQTIQIKDAASEANRRHFAAGTSQPDITCCKV